MLPVCSAAPTCSSHHQISFHVGIKAFYPFRKALEDRCMSEERTTFSIQDGLHAQHLSFRTNDTPCMHSLVVERPEQHSSLDSSIFSPYPNEFDDIVRGFSKDYVDKEPEICSFSNREINDLYHIGEDLKYVESSDVSGPGLLLREFGNDIENRVTDHDVLTEPLTSSYKELSSASSSGENEFFSLPNSLGQSSDTLAKSTSSGSAVSTDASTSGISESTMPFSSSLENNTGIVDLKADIQQFLSGTNKSVNASIEQAKDAATRTYNAFTSSVLDTVENVKNSIDSAVNGLFFSIDNTKGVAGSKLTSLSGELKETTYRSSILAVDNLRQAIVAVEGSFVNAAKFVVYSYGSAKSLLPPDARNALNFSEEKAIEILRPIGATFQQIFIIVEKLEKNLGLDPNDPIVPFVILLGSSAIIGISYWWFNYGGYSGDLNPELTLELLKNEENVVLIDVRPEDLRVRDGVPDLRQAARSKYASITIPEIDGSLRKLLKSGRDINDALLAVVIRNLKIVQDGSKVIIMDSAGSRSKGIARSLKKLGVGKPYLVRGGFRSWVKNGLRVKELKPETALTVLNEEAQAILENIKPTRSLLIAYGLGFSAAVYALVEWEKTLQIIGLIGLGQTIYRRFASYKGSEDLKQDIRLLLAPVRWGSEAFSWVARKLEPNKIGLPTSPSSTAVQDRVLQAAAKHESQPPDSEEAQGLPREPASENLDLSEA